MSLGKFSKNHYEKIILVFLLIIFAILLVWQVSVTQEAQNKRVDKIVNRKDGGSNYRSPYDFNSAEFDLNAIFSKDLAWQRHEKSDSLDSLRTDLLVGYQLARCVYCNKLIPAASYPKKGMTENGKCPMCGKELVPKRYDDVDPDDRNANGIPDITELQMGFDLNDPYAVETDTDGDGFTFREEFLAGTKWDDAESHPPLAAKLSVYQVAKTKVNGLLLKRINYPSETAQNQNDYEFSFRCVYGNRTRTQFVKINETFKLNDKDENTYKVISVKKPNSKNYDVLQNEAVVTICRNDDYDNLLSAQVDKPIDDPKETVIFYNSITNHFESRLNGSEFEIGNNTMGRETFRIIAVDPVESTATVEGVDAPSMGDNKTFVIQKSSIQEEDNGYGGGYGGYPMGGNYRGTSNGIPPHLR